MNIKLIIPVLIITNKSLIVNAIPVKADSDRDSVSVGPCTWVLSRTCPDPDVKFYIFTRTNPSDRQYVHIDESLEKSNISESNFDAFDPTKVIIHGYNADMFLTPLIDMRDEYLNRGAYNLFYVDWSVLGPGPCYPSAVHNVRHVGTCVGQLVERILDMGTENIHLIGFSLGAQMTNYIAQAVAPFRIPRISGLDPAMPLFVTSTKEDKLDESDAEFVDVIHTNALVQGKMERCGHADFYLNGGIIQPGCTGFGLNPFACSHHRAPDYFAESIRSFTGFWGWGCESYIYYLLGMCPPKNPLVIAGEDCRSDVRGMFIITTNSISPFAQGKWNDLTAPLNAEPPQIPQFLKKRDPFETAIDRWGKLEGGFNNNHGSYHDSLEFDVENWSISYVSSGNRIKNKPRNSTRYRPFRRWRNLTKVDQ